MQLQITVDLFVVVTTLMIEKIGGPVVQHNGRFLGRWVNHINRTGAENAGSIGSRSINQRVSQAIIILINRLGKDHSSVIVSVKFLCPQLANIQLRL